MKPIPYCVPDIIRLVLDSAELVSDDKFIHRKVLSKVLAEIVEDGDLGADAGELALRCLTSAYKALGVKDPYEKEKARRNRAMLGLEKSFRQYLDVAGNRLSACINLALSGSFHATRVLGRAEAERAILEQFDEQIGRDDREQLVRALARAEHVLYIVDRSGEIVFDKLLMEEIGGRRKVTAVVAPVPMLDMATMADAKAVGLPEIAEVIQPGGRMMGLSLEKASSAFREIFFGADVVIAKGENHFEQLHSTEREMFYLFKAQCPSVAERVGVERGSGVLLHRPGRAGTGVFETAHAADESVDG